MSNDMNNHIKYGDMKNHPKFGNGMGMNNHIKYRDDIKNHIKYRDGMGMKNHSKFAVKKSSKFGDDMKNHPNYGDDTITIQSSNGPIVLNRINHGDKVRIMHDTYSDVGTLVLTLDEGSARDKFTYHGTYGVWTIELADGSLYQSVGPVYPIPDRY